MALKPAWSAAWAISLSVGPRRAGPPGQLKSTICSANFIGHRPVRPLPPRPGAPRRPAEEEEAPDQQRPDGEEAVRVAAAEDPPGDPERRDQREDGGEGVDAAPPGPRGRRRLRLDQRRQIGEELVQGGARARVEGGVEALSILLRG